MRRVIKKVNSKILIGNWKYIKGNSKNNQKISNALIGEQCNICVYTETYLGRTDKAEIDHFNPNLKGTNQDGYNNWFLVKAKWNSEKSQKWVNFQPTLQPISLDLEQRIVYDSGDYVVSNAPDPQAQNLIKLLKLDDPDLASQRRRYIKRKRDEIISSGTTPKEHFDLLLTDYPEGVYFIRALREEFGWEHPQITY